MPPAVSEWSNLILRWIHVLVGILWVGQTYYFTKLDGRLAAAENLAGGSGRPGQVWLVNSGGFFVTERRSTVADLPPKLYWFRWEAALTWFSGFLLLGLIYYSDGLLLNDAGPHIGMGMGVAIGIGVLIVGWTVYDLLWISPLGRSAIAGTTVSFLLLLALSYGLTRVMSGRAAYIHVGALLGTIMAANVWMRILPVQKKMLAAVRQGRQPDKALEARARMRSKHNTFMAVPVVFLMISNHFPLATYGQSYNWLILPALVLAGFVAAQIIYKS